MDEFEGQVNLLECGSIEVLGQLANSSNETFLVEMTQDDAQHWAIYKPELGERPLRDFPPGLYHRERAAWLLSDSLGWGIVPPTVVRADAPFGVGSLQWFVNHDPNRHYFTLFDEGLFNEGLFEVGSFEEELFEEEPDLHDQLRRMAVFDLLANNADRKAGHVLLGEDDRLWGIDHGLCFAAPFKLRTVMWDFAGERIDAGLLADVDRLADTWPGELTEHLSWFEIEALRQRVRDLLLEGEFPEDPTGMRFPWPLV